MKRITALKDIEITVWIVAERRDPNGPIDQYERKILPLKKGDVLGSVWMVESLIPILAPEQFLEPRPSSIRGDSTLHEKWFQTEIEP